MNNSTIDERELSFYGGTIINLPKKDEDYPIDFPITKGAEMKYPRIRFEAIVLLSVFFLEFIRIFLRSKRA